jgi:quinol-cytochrome oxidoreductase complex cytochrome b subunit
LVIGGGNIIFLVHYLTIFSSMLMLIIVIKIFGFKKVHFTPIQKTKNKNHEKGKKKLKKKKDCRGIH